MCGFLFCDGKVRRKAKTALDLMEFRGPDTSCTMTAGGFFLGHKRLTILDLSSAGNQPMYSKSRRHIILYNGEIYNFRELAKKYSIPLETKCDTELLVELFERIGVKMLDKLNGMFSFVILNVETGGVLAARDRLGIKPLYVSKHDGKLIYCSEVAPIRRIIDSNTIDEIGLRQYRKLRTFFRGHTIWKEISMFPAGHYYESSTGSYIRYWDLTNEKQAAPSDEELLYLLKSSVEYRMISDVPLGCFLSGGLDSSIVASLMKRVETWSVGTAENNEFDWSRKVARNLGMPHNMVVIDPEQYRSILGRMVSARGEPLSVPNEVMIYAMARKAKEKNTVILGGEGADELFFGYDRIFRWANSSEWTIEEFDAHYSYSKGKDLEILEYVVEPYMVQSKTALKTVARFFQLAHLHGLLRRVDFATMLASVEARVPFLDHRLVERMAGVPFDYRMEGGIVKNPLKRVFGHLIPKEVVERKKIGFPVDLEKVLGIPNAGYEEFLELNLQLLEK